MNPKDFLEHPYQGFSLPLIRSSCASTQPLALILRLASGAGRAVPGRSPRRPLLARLVDAVRLSLGPGPRQPAGAAPASTLPVVRAPGHAALVPVPDRQCRTGRRGRAHAGTFRPQVPAGSAVRQQLHPGRRPRPPATGARPRWRDIALRAALASPRSAPAALCLALPAAFLAAHVGLQYLRPSDADQWQQYNLPHKLLPARSAVANWRSKTGSPTTVRTPRRTSPGSTSSTFPERRCWPAEARAQRPDRGHGGNPRRVYRRQPRRHQQQLPRSADAQTEWLGRTGDDHPGLRAAQPPDHPRPLRHALRRRQQARLGHAEGAPSCSTTRPGQECLPAQLRQHGFSTHFLQGAGLRFMAKDKVMPQMGFDKTLGRDWFRNTSYLEFPGAWTTRPSSRAPRPT